ncbi:MAG: hypothetical protein ABTD50_12490 [Polyangiaceae bacterium]
MASSDMVTPRRQWSVGSIALAVFVVAFAVRFVWAVFVQRPHAAVYTDMQGYVDRAVWLLDNSAPPDPRAQTFYPYGAHALIALEFLVFGRNSEIAIAIVHALVGAVPAACMVPLTLRLIPSRSAAAFVGLVVSFWQPQIIYVGFFLSEIWFCAAIALHACATVDARRSNLRLLAAGVLSGIAFVVRPQFLLTWVLDSLEHAIAWLRRPGLRRTLWAIGCLVLPMALAVGYSGARHYRLTGRWGLISDNANLNRFFADTDVCEVQGNWITPTGDRWQYVFGPPAKPQPCGGDRVVHFDGYIGDPTILDHLRRARLHGVPWFDRIARMAGNVSLLAAKNTPFPESGRGWRGILQRDFSAVVLWAVFPLCAVGLALGRRDRLKFVALANFASVVVAAALYYGESRYRVPYDPFAILFAAVGVYEVAIRVGHLARRARAMLLQSRRNAGPLEGE